MPDRWIGRQNKFSSVNSYLVHIFSNRYPCGLVRTKPYTSIWQQDTLRRPEIPTSVWKQLDYKRSCSTDIPGMYVRIRLSI